MHILSASPDRFRARRALLQTPRRQRPAAARGAFTLFEFLLILAILVTVVAVSWPALSQFHLQYQLRQAGALVQARMGGARVHAVDSGVDYQFRFEPGGQRFLVIPSDQQALAASAASAGATGGAGSNPASGGGSNRHYHKVAGRLPSAKAHFDPTSTGGTVPQPIPGEWLSGIHDADQFGGVNWSAPILFHADGTAAPAHIVIRDAKSRTVTISVRALTGGVSLSKIVVAGTP
jgi:hypothetical protein